MAVSIDIECSVGVGREVLWVELSQISRHVLWMKDAKRITFTSPIHRGVGTTFDCLTKIGPFKVVDAMDIVTWEEGESIGVVHKGVFRGTGVLAAVVGPDGTSIVRWREEIQFPWFLGGDLTGFLALPIFKHLWRANLIRLSDLMPIDQGTPE